MTEQEFNDLYQRHQRKKRRQIITSSMAVIGATLRLLAYSMIWMSIMGRLDCQVLI